MKEVTYEEWQKNPIPRMMWVWDDDVKQKVKRKVISILSKEPFPVPAVDKFDNFAMWQHCAEIEESEKRRMTYQELAWWLRDNNRREYKYAEGFGGVFFEFAYDENEEDILVEEGILIRENGGEWHEPLVEVVE